MTLLIKYSDIILYFILFVYFFKIISKIYFLKMEISLEADLFNIEKVNIH